MGADIGTSLSKVVVLVESRRIAVRFDEPGSENPYLLPTALSVMPDGECRLGVHDGARRCDDIKRPLIDGKTDEDVQIPLIAFMALLFRRVQQLIAESEGRLLIGNPVWLVNLGVPTESYGGGTSGETELAEAYRQGAHTAWSLMKQMSKEGNDDRLTLANVRQAMEKKSDDRDDRIKVFPELVAQVASYVMSKQRKVGVHVLMDAGGGTLDVTVFYVRPSSDDSETVPVYAASVQPLGTRYLMNRISKSSGRDLTLSPVEHFPPEAEIARSIGVSLEELRRIVEPFHRRVRKAVGERILKTGMTFDGLEWPARMFLVGGGASVELYKRVADVLAKIENSAFKVRLAPLSRPDDLVAPGLTDSRWHRLAVAYGLAFDPFNIREIIPPWDIDPNPCRDSKPAKPRPPWVGSW